MQATRIRRVQKLVLEAMQPAFEALNLRPFAQPRLWSSPYLLGYLQGQATEYIDYLGGIALSLSEKRAIFRGVVHAGARQHGRVALAHCARLMGAPDPCYATGLHRGRALMRFRFDLDHAPDALPLVQEIAGIDPQPAAVLAKHDILRLLHHHYWERQVERVANGQA